MSFFARHSRLAVGAALTACAAATGANSSEPPSGATPREAPRPTPGDLADAAPASRVAVRTGEIADAAPVASEPAGPTTAQGDAGPGLSPASVLGLEAAEAWLAKNRVRTPDAVNLVSGCEPFVIRPTNREALWCIGNRGPMAGSLPTGESVFPLTVLVVDGGRLRVALELPIMAGPLDRMTDPDQANDPNDPNDGNYIVLVARRSTDGVTLTVEEQSQPQAKCASVLAAHGAPDLAKHRKMIARACASRGAFEWRGGRFVRAAAAH